jgi:hypothetical protein
MSGEEDNMNDQADTYEPPAIIEVGDFREVTRVTSSGSHPDNPIIGLWCAGPGGDCD